MGERSIAKIRLQNVVCVIPPYVYYFNYGEHLAKISLNDKKLRNYVVNETSRNKINAVFLQILKANGHEFVVEDFVTERLGTFLDGLLDRYRIDFFDAIKKNEYRSRSTEKYLKKLDQNCETAFPDFFRKSGPSLLTARADIEFHDGWFSVTYPLRKYECAAMNNMKEYAVSDYCAFFRDNRKNLMRMLQYSIENNYIAMDKIIGVSLYHMTDCVVGDDSTVMFTFALKPQYEFLFSKA